MEDEARLERERHEKERLVALKNKEKKEQSAVASSEVKQKLQVNNGIARKCVSRLMSTKTKSRVVSLKFLVFLHHVIRSAVFFQLFEMRQTIR